MASKPKILRNVRAGRESIPPGHDAPRHRHLRAYALVVVRGAVAQASYAGRVVARSGDVLLQPTLDCHANALQSAGVDILRLPWGRVEDLGGCYRLADLDEVVRLAERDAQEAGLRLAAEIAAAARGPSANDWPDLLAADICSVQELRAWAETRGLRAETVSRGFARAFGVTPGRFRAELQARRAWLRITGSRDHLARIAADTGYCNQPHMSRAVSRLTGASPNVWRSRPA